MTTCTTTAEDVANPASRLDRFAACDPAQAQRLRDAIGDALDFLPLAEPSDEDRQRIETWLAEAEADLIVVPGLGEGRELCALLDALPDTASLLILERDAGRLARLFLRNPLETLAETGRLKLNAGEDGMAVASAMGSMLDLPKKPRIRLFDLTSVPPEDASIYAAALMAAREHMRLSVSNLRTLIVQGPHGQYNAFKNLPLLVRQPSVARLFGLFPGKPALVAAAGPSLSSALPHIAKHRAGFVLVAVGTALRPLAQAGIKPDLAVTADPSYLTGRQFTCDCTDLYLVSTLMGFPPVLRQCKGVFVTCESGNPVGQWARQYFDRPASLAAAGTVTLTAMDMAVKFGCDPVATVGLDLCLGADGSSHADYSMYHGRKASQEVIRKLIPVPGNRRDTVYTMPNMRNYIELIGNYALRRFGTRLVNLNTDGARIRGLELADPESMGELAGDPFDAHAAIEDAYRNRRPSESAPALAQALNEAVDRLAETGALATQAAMLCNRLIALLRQPGPGDEARARTWLDKLTETDKHLLETRDANMLTSMCMRAACFSMSAKKSEQEEKFSEGILIHHRSRRYYEAYARIANRTAALAQEAREAIETEREPDLTAFESNPMARDLLSG